MYLALSTLHHGDIYESPCVEDSLVCASLGDLLLLLRLDFRGLRLDFA